MNSDLIKNITDEEAVETIYSTINSKNEKTYINYLIVLDIDNIVEDKELLKKLVANMEILKALLSKENVVFSYTLITEKEFHNKANAKEMQKRIEKASILYAKYDDNFNFESNNTYKRA